VSGRTYYRAVMPREAWNSGREPRERRRRRRAVDDLIAGLDRYLAKRTIEDPLLFRAANGEPVRLEHTDRVMLTQWVTWAARLCDPYVRYGFGPAPDGSEWRIHSRWELL
jgi:hypothetical protein